MANCEIQDAVGAWSAAGTFTGTPGLIVYAIPDASWRTYDVSGTYRPLGINTAISVAAYQRGRTATTDASGVWSHFLPYPTSTYPTTPAPVWSIVLPSGDIWSGEVPAVAGPLTLKTLEQTYNWAQTGSIYVAPVTPGTLAEGIATFTAATTAAILFSTPFASDTYRITLTPSVDSVTGNIPAVGYASKTTSGYTITSTGVFTGKVDWTAKL